MESAELKNKGDKARAAAKAGQILKSLGVPHDEAAQAAHHELQHALADPGPGKIGVDIDPKNLTAKPNYQAIGERSPEQELEYTKAATDGLSESDKKRINELESEISKKKG